MATSVLQKLNIRENYALLTINAPADFVAGLMELPAGVTISANAEQYNQIHWFVKDKEQLNTDVAGVIALLRDAVVCWIYYPKGTSNIQTDLTRDKGWETLLAYGHLQWISLISFNPTWSAFGMRLKTDADKKKEAKPKERPVFNYIDAVKKTIRLPHDFAAALEKAPAEKGFFNSLSFTNKKEYLEWIVTAKREETKLLRISGSLERLAKRWKNPANR